MRMRVCYVAHPFLGKKKNVKDVEKIIKHLVHVFPDTVFYSPLHATGFYYHDKTKENGMKDCIELLSRCDELWLTGDYWESEGCMQELNWALNHNMPINVVNKENMIVEKFKKQKDVDG